MVKATILVVEETGPIPVVVAVVGEEKKQATRKNHQNSTKNNTSRDKRENTGKQKNKTQEKKTLLAV